MREQVSSRKYALKVSGLDLETSYRGNLRVRTQVKGKKNRKEAGGERTELDKGSEEGVRYVEHGAKNPEE